ncbi:DUF4956 domain-containing protein [Acetivibrio cellulolyticus]|uniref:DUF4956 domain-containing protein n=1 Tax=Acetivibrio cellulolyticus TaxID=35830 RepID=UPI0001E2D8A3|nr:DUF4956 domain-containing protein [Acetivibrio cellulolyticus]
MEAFFNTATESLQLSLGSAVLTIIVAFALGLLISLTYIKTYSKGNYSQNFVLTLIMIPCIIAIIILLIGSNIARAFGLSGAFSIIRFRSAPGDPKDIAYVFFSMGAGLACGVGVYGYAILFTLVLCAFMILLCKINFGARKTSDKILKIIIPEDLDYQGVFDDLFEAYTYRHELKKVKTTDLGTLYELVYIVNMKQNVREKEFLDEIRCRNGNLNIILAMNAEPADC